MKLEIKTPAGTLHLKPANKKDLKRFDELMTDKKGYLEDDIEEELLWSMISDCFVSKLDSAAFWCMITDDRKVTMQTWKEFSQSHHNFNEALNELTDDGSNKDDRKPVEAPQGDSISLKCREFIKKILSPQKAK
jgi:hypothetical protein